MLMTIQRHWEQDRAVDTGDGMRTKFVLKTMRLAACKHRMHASLQIERSKLIPMHALISTDPFLLPVEPRLSFYLDKWLVPWKVALPCYVIPQRQFSQRCVPQGQHLSAAGVLSRLT